MISKSVSCSLRSQHSYIWTAFVETQNLATPFLSLIEDEVFKLIIKSEFQIWWKKYKKKIFVCGIQTLS